MKAAHRTWASSKDMNGLVENLQRAMAAEGVPFAAQNRFLAKLAPMKRDVVESLKPDFARITTLKSRLH